MAEHRMDIGVQVPSTKAKLLFKDVFISLSSSYKKLNGTHLHSLALKYSG